MPNLIYAPFRYSRINILSFMNIGFVVSEELVVLIPNNKLYELGD